MVFIHSILIPAHAYKEYIKPTASIIYKQVVWLNCGQENTFFTY